MQKCEKPMADKEKKKIKVEKKRKRTKGAIKKKKSSNEIDQPFRFKVVQSQLWQTAYCGGAWDESQEERKKGTRDEKKIDERKINFSQNFFFFFNSDPLSPSPPPPPPKADVKKKGWRSHWTSWTETTSLFKFKQKKKNLDLKEN